MPESKIEKCIRMVYPNAIVNIASDEYGFKMTTGYYDICHSEEDLILRIQNRVRRFMITHPDVNKKEN